MKTDEKGVIYAVAFGSDGYAGYSVFWIFKDQSTSLLFIKEQ